MVGKAFQVKWERVQTFHEGWGVDCCVIWEDEGERVSDVDVNVVRIDEDAVSIIGGEPCVQVRYDSAGHGYYVPVASFHDVGDLAVGDTHDFRSRYFETEAEARDHARSVAERWAHPQPWESFIQL